MKIKMFVFNSFQENTYLLINEENECIIIDPGCLYQEEKERLSTYLDENKLILKRILNTHLHLDHVFGNMYLYEKYGVLAEAHKNDEFLLNTIVPSALNFGITEKIDQPVLKGYLREGDRIQLGDIDLQIFHIPGHSPGSLVFYAEKEKCIFSGDVLFQGCIGRSDLQKGNFAVLVDGIKKKLFTLPDEAVVFCGHGPKTTIGFEKMYNQYVV